MEFLRNPEMKREIVVHIILGILSVIFMYMLCGMKGAGGAIVICLLFLTLLFLYNYIRYRNISKMGQQIDRILHGEEVSLMQDCQEGDLAVLSTQINKMVRRLKEQSDILVQEKIFMADSLADISHQIKTPLTSISLILSFLREEELSIEKRFLLVQELTKLTNRIDWLIYALLRMSKLDAGTVTLQQEKILLKELLSKAYDVIAIPLDIRNIQFQCQIKEGASIFGDMAWMTEAVGNILKNCMEHTPKGGKICVFCEENPLYTLIRIEDTGDGIAKEDLPHVFERFYRGKNADSQSVGIGLALSRKIITAQNGTIKAMNRKEGHGAVFEIRCYKSVV